MEASVQTEILSYLLLIYYSNPVTIPSVFLLVLCVSDGHDVTYNPCQVVTNGWTGELLNLDFIVVDSV